MPNPNTVISDKEIKAAIALASRANGATRSELASRLKCSPARAANVFKKAGRKIKRAGFRNARRGRAIVYAT